MRQFRLHILFSDPPTAQEADAVFRFQQALRDQMGVETVQEGNTRPGDLLLRICRLSRTATPSLQFQVAPDCLRLNCSPETLALGLNEIRTQLTGILTPGHRGGWHPFHLTARFAFRGLRIGPDLWSSEDFRERLELLSTLGLNTLALDIVRLPMTVESVEEETQPGEWLEAIRPKIERVREFGLEPILNFPIQLDLHPTGGANGCPVSRRQFCRQQASGKRQIIHRFENLAEVLPAVAGIGFVISNWGRCECDLCQATTFEEEAAYYLRAFAAVLRRYRPEFSMWSFPDAISQHGLEEIKSQIPPGVRILAPNLNPSPRSIARIRSPREGEMGDLWDEAGEIYLLDTPLESDFFRMDRIMEFLDRWENLGPPHSFFGDLHAFATPPLNTLSLFPLFWEGTFPGGDGEEWVYRKMLPVTEWESWAFWKETNRRFLSGLLKKSMEVKTNRPALLALDESSPRPSLPFDLPRTLTKMAKRLRLDEELIEIEKDFRRIPEGERVHGKTLYSLQTLVGRIYSLLHPDQDWDLEIAERRCLESLSDFLNLLLSDGRNREVWSLDTMPDLRSLSIHRLTMSREER